MPTGWPRTGWGGAEAPVSEGIPLAPTDPVLYLPWLLQYQQPFGGPRVELPSGDPLAFNFQWQFDNLTDLIAIETLVEVGTVPLTVLSAAPETSSDIQSPLVTGYATINNAADALVAATSAVQDITDSALIIWCARYPSTSAGTDGVVNKRAGADPFEGWESGINAAGMAQATLDGGVASVVLQLMQNDVAEVPGGVWHWYALLVDAVEGQCQMASDRSSTSWTALPAGSLSTSTLLSLGDGRLSAQNMDILFQAAIMGPSIANIFGSPNEAASGSNDPTKPNIQYNVCAVLANATVRTVTVDPIP